MNYIVIGGANQELVGTFKDFIDACDSAIGLNAEDGFLYTVWESQKAWTTGMLDNKVVYHNFQNVNIAVKSA